MSPAPSVQNVIQQVEQEAVDPRPLPRLQTASLLVQAFAEVGDAVLGYFVDQARHAGHSWSEIGEALGVSKQAAQQKHTSRSVHAISSAAFDRFTGRARAAVAAGESVARDLGHGFIGTEHLLLALYKDPNGLAAQILSESGLEAAAAEAAVLQRIGRGPGAPADRIPFTPRAAAVLREAMAVALGMGHNYIGTEHLLLGMATGDGVGADVLAQAGLTVESLTSRVTAKLASYQPGRGPLAATQARVKKAVAKTAAGKKAAGRKAAAKKAVAKRAPR